MVVGSTWYLPSSNESTLHPCTRLPSNKSHPVASVASSSIYRDRSHMPLSAPCASPRTIGTFCLFVGRHLRLMDHDRKPKASRQWLAARPFNPNVQNCPCRVERAPQPQSKHEANWLKR